MYTPYLSIYLSIYLYLSVPVYIYIYVYVHIYIYPSISIYVVSGHALVEAEVAAEIGAGRQLYICVYIW